MLEVGSYKQTLTCGDEIIDFEVFVYNTIGGQRGEANTVATLVIAGSISTLVLFGASRIAGRRDDLV